MATVFLTGANRGLGLEFARQYAARGDTLIATARDVSGADDLQEVAQQHSGTVRLLQLDVADRASIDAARRQIADTPIDIVLNNAGVLSRSESEKIDYDVMHEALLVNTLAPVYIASSLLDNVRAGAARKIVTITSHMGSFAQGGSGILSYRTSKAAVNRAMATFAEAMRGERIAVGLFHPGWVRTSMGGSSASLSPERSAASLIKQIDALTLEQSGTFRSYDGSTIPW